MPTPAPSGPSTSASQPSTENALPRGPSNSPALPMYNRTSSKPLPPVPRVSESAHTPGPSESIPSSDQEAMDSSEPKPEPPKWSVEYHPEAKRVLEFNLENVITYSLSVLCVRISPDGHRVAIGLRNGITYLMDSKTGSNIWLVSDRLVHSLEFRLT